MERCVEYPGVNSPSTERLLRSRPVPSEYLCYGATDRWRRLIAMVATVVFGIPTVCIGQHLLAYRLATALCLDAVDHCLQFLRSVDREHLAQVVAFLVPVLEPHWPPGVVGPQLTVPLEANSGVSLRTPPW